MIKPTALVTCLLAFVTVGAFAQSGVTVSVREVMAGEINPAVLAIWDVGNVAMNDDGGIDPGLMNADRWNIIVTEADALAAIGKHMASAESFIAATPGNNVVGEGEATMAQIQAHLDADQAGFRQLSAAFADHAGKLAAAARARDAVATGALIGEMDAVCEGCHTRYWYPE